MRSCFIRVLFFAATVNADYLGISFQSLYKELKEWSPYYLKKMLLCFMIHQAVEELKPILEKSAATQSRAGISLS